MRYWTVDEAQAYLPRLRLLLGVIRRATHLAVSARGNGHAVLPGRPLAGPGRPLPGPAPLRVAGFRDSVRGASRCPRTRRVGAGRCRSTSRRPWPSSRTRDRPARPRAGADRLHRAAQRAGGAAVLAARRGRAGVVALSRGRLRRPSPPAAASRALTCLPSSDLAPRADPGRTRTHPTFDCVGPVTAAFRFPGGP